MDRSQVLEKKERFFVIFIGRTRRRGGKSAGMGLELCERREKTISNYIPYPIGGGGEKGGSLVRYPKEQFKKTRLPWESGPSVVVMRVVVAQSAEEELGRTPPK